MSIAAEVAKKVEKETAPGCKLGALLPSLDEDDRTALLLAIDKVRSDSINLPVNNRYFTIAWLVQILNDNHHKLGKTVVSEHVRKVCACEQPSK